MNDSMRVGIFTQPNPFLETAPRGLHIINGKEERHSLLVDARAVGMKDYLFVARRALWKLFSSLAREASSVRNIRENMHER